jgi:glycosidase
MSLDAWKDSVIYFVMIDRFCNADRSTDDFGQGEYDPHDDDCFHGGDLKGVRQRLPFIKSMGYDAVWITPPVHNQWINPYIRTRGYHGYWAYDFTRVDPHFGTLSDYKALVEEAHRLGLKVIQDIVVNHTGNYFTVDGTGYNARHPERNWKECDAVPPEGSPKAPNDPVFRMNNPNVPTHKAAAVYNFTPNITDFKDRRQTLTYAMGDLDDINLRAPLAIARMKEIYRYWIEAVGVDGFRVDTVYYTPEAFYEKFLHDEDGIKPFAERKGKSDFLVFGEVWSYDYAAINKYLDGGRRPRLDSAIDHPLNEALTQVFYRKAPTEALARPLRARRPNRHLWVNFLDNHDVERMFARAAWPAVQQSLVALFTLPGIPCITYGTEAGFTRSRQDMFSDKHCDERQAPAAFLKELIAFRKSDPVFSRGEVRVERTGPTCGVLSYSVTLGRERRLVVFNTAPNAVFTDLPGGGYDVLLSSEGRTSVGASCVLAPEAWLVLKETQAPARNKRVAPAGLSVRAGGRAAMGTVKLPLSARAAASVKQAWLLADGDFDARRAIEDLKAKSFSLDTSELGNGKHTLRVVSELATGEMTGSPCVPFLVRNAYKPLAEAAVAEGDKGGVGVPIHPPGDPSYGGQLSMEGASAATSGRDLRLTVRMASVTNEWNPPHGFDHVYFSVFLDFPGRKGKRFFPRLRYAREDFEFNTGFLLYGWGTRSFGAADSTPDAYGAPLVGDVEYAVDRARRTISFTFSSRFFDGLKTFAGTKIFVSTWDGYLGELRTVAGQREDWNFYILPGPSKTDPEALPRVFDHLLIQL